MIASRADLRAYLEADRVLRDAATAADLNPLSAEPGRVGGTIALRSGRPLEAQQRFEQAIERLN